MALFLTVAASACGGHVIQSAPDASAGTDPPSSPPPPDDAGTGATPPTGSSTFPICPGMEPATGSACPTPSQGCAYVDVTLGTCESWTCDPSGHWVSSTPAGC